jgi:hypothetical protein
MELDLDEVRRTVWRVEDPVWFFQKMRPLLTTIDDLEANEIEAQLKDGDFEYVEVATLLPHSDSEDPDAILVFENDQVYWDIVNPKVFAQLTKTVERLTYPKAKHTKTRRLTEEDWVLRIQAMQSAELF